MIDKILLAVDGSYHAQRATDLAAELADKLKANLFIVHVLMHNRPGAELVRMAEVEHLVEQAHAIAVPNTPYAQGQYFEILNRPSIDAENARVISALGDQIVARAKARCRDLGVDTAKTFVRAGDYADEILEVAQDIGADMVVVGSRGLGTVKSTVLGSVSQKLLHHADCTVTVVH